jgi:peptidoglycan/xylan/chitin deacetylase (PgdA/CDA1 family)
MALTLVPLVLDLYDGAGNLISSGTVTLTPSASLTDTTDGADVVQAPVTAAFTSAGSPLVSILPTDSANLAPSGWGWEAVFSGIPGTIPASYTFFITGTGNYWSFTATSASPAVFTASGSSLANGTQVVLHGSVPGQFLASTIYYVVSAAGTTFSLAATSGGSALGSSSAGSGTVAAVQSLSSLSPVSSVTTMAAYAEVPAGDLGGTSADPLVTGIQGVAVASAAATPSAWQLLTYSGDTDDWITSENLAPARGFQPPAPVLSQAIWMGQTGGPFAIGGTHSAGSNAYTGSFSIGSQCYYVTTNGSGSQATIAGAFTSPLNLTNQSLVVWLRVASLSNLLGGYPRLYVGNSAFTAAYFWKVYSSPTQPWALDGEWMKITLPFGTAGIVGSPNRASLTNLEFQVYDDSAGEASLYFGGIAAMPEPSAFPNGVVSLTFDDGYISASETAAPMMDAYGYRGTSFLIGQVVQGGGSAPYQNYMNIAQAQTLEAQNGWECGSHAWSATVHNEGYVVAGDTVALQDAASAKAFVTEQGFKVPWLHAYPLGAFDAGTILNTRELFGAARTISSLGGFPDETFPPAQLSRLRAFAVSEAANSGLANIEPFITAAQANHEWLIFCLHDIQASASGSLQFSTAHFATMLAYLQSTGIPVLPVSEVLEQGITMQPVTSLGDVVYGNAGGVPARLAGNTEALPMFLESLGTGSATQAPSFNTVSGQMLAVNQWAPGSQTGAAYPIATTVASGSNGGEISTIATWGGTYGGNGVLDVAANSTYPTSGTLNVAASGSTTAVITYTGTSAGTSFTGCVYVSGSATGTLTTGGAVALVSFAPLSSANVNTGNFIAPPSGNILVTASFTGKAASGVFNSFALAAHGTLSPLSNQWQLDDVTSDAQFKHCEWYITGLTNGSTYNYDLMCCSSGAYDIYAIGETSATPNLTGSNQGSPVVMTVRAV